MSVVGPTVWAAPMGKDQGLSCSATVSGGGATALHGWCWWPGKGCHPPQLMPQLDGLLQGLSGLVASTLAAGGGGEGCREGRNGAAVRVADAPRL